MEEAKPIGKNKFTNFQKEIIKQALEFYLDTCLMDDPNEHFSDAWLYENPEEMRSLLMKHYTNILDICEKININMEIPKEEVLRSFEHELSQKTSLREGKSED